MIACDLFIAISAARLGETESLVLATALHQLYGPAKRPVAVLSAAEIAKETGLDKSSVIRARNRLVGLRILIETEGGFAFQKDYEAWRRPDGRPLLSDVMAHYAALFLLPIKAKKRRVAQKSPEGGAEVTLGVAQKSPAAPAPDRNARQKTSEDSQKNRAIQEVPHHAGETSSTIAPTDPSPTPIRNATPIASSAASPAPAGITPADVALAAKIQAMVLDYVGSDRGDLAEEFAKHAVSWHRAGIGFAAIVEAFRSAIEADVRAESLATYASKKAASLDRTLRAVPTPTSAAHADRPAGPSHPASNVHVMSPEARRQALEQRARKLAAMRGES